MTSLCKRLGELEFPPCSLGDITEMSCLLYTIGQAETSSKRRWLLLGFFLQQKGTGTRWTKGNSLLLASSYQITLEKGKPRQDRWCNCSWECLWGLLAHVSWMIASFPLSCKKGNAGWRIENSCVSTGLQYCPYISHWFTKLGHQIQPAALLGRHWRS